MDFGKLPSVDRVDFRLPEEPRQNTRILPGSPADMPTLYVGPTGYNMKPWVGKWYPAGAAERSFLKHYGAQFNTIEFNTTHYRIPDQATIERWKNDAPLDFRFCPKIPQSISHAADLGVNSPDLPFFCAQITMLKPVLGVCFMQLPPQFGPRDLPKLERFLKKWPSDLPLSVEVRHPLFFESDIHAEAYFALLEDFNVDTVMTDVSGRRDVLHMRLTSARAALIRFVGNALHPSDYTRIDEWSQRLASWFEHGLQSVYFFTHEPDNLLAPELAAYCVDTFSKAMPGVQMRGPKVVGGQQGSLFD